MPIAATQLENKILNIIEEPTKALGYDIVRIRYSRTGSNKTLQIMIERIDQEPITIKDCETVSKQTSVLLDVEDPISDPFNLEISSPGLNRPLTKLEDFEKFKGQKAKVTLIHSIDNRKNFTGIIEGIEEKQVKLYLEDQKEAMTINFSAIAESNLIFQP